MNIWTEAFRYSSSSSARTCRTAGSTTHVGASSIANRGWQARTSRAGPQAGARWHHMSSTTSAGPTSEGQIRCCSIARSANKRVASGPPASGMMVVPTKHSESASTPVDQISPPIAVGSAPRASTRAASMQDATGSISRTARTASVSDNPSTRTASEDDAPGAPGAGSVVVIGNRSRAQASSRERS
ncbi:Uncharacterised protein [Mycobacteroides abscessus]|nr:Uncharacterised protein [Mycobacteroides abscessus]